MNRAEARNSIIVTAANQVGYHANPDKTNKYAAYFDDIHPDFYNGKKNGYDWCEIFCDWCFCNTFGYDLGRRMIYQPLHSAGAGVNSSASYYKQAGAWSHLPSLGAQIYFQDDDGLYHTGLVVGIKDGRVYTIEGNTGDTKGGEVMRHNYPQNAVYIAGYGVPDWDLAKDTKMSPKDITDEIYKKVLNTLAGEYGTNPERKKKLGEWYDPVQWVINYYFSQEG